MQKSLLGVLAGDVAYKIGRGGGALKFRKDKLLGEDLAADVRTEQWLMTIDYVAFIDCEGVRRTDLDGDVQSLIGI